MHESGLVVCPVTGQQIRVTRSQVGDVVVSSVKPGSPQQPNQSGATRVAPTRASRRDLIGQIIDGKYKVRAMLGEGGMGAVLEAEHQVIGRSVAMKVLHAAQATKSVAIKRFHQEARAAGGIGHPNICEVFDFGSLADGSPYLVMERLQGQTLAARIEREGGLPFGDVVETVIQVLSGLGAAHERGILHRDIKPENVFLAERPGYPPIVKLLDFGVSKILAGAQGDWDDETDLTKTGMVMGTPYYMSPEQARGDRNLDARVDVYACGVMLYEALTGKRPFIANNYNSLLVMILRGNLALPRTLRPSIPAELEEIVMKAMARDRENRFQTAADFARALGPIRKQMARTSSGQVPTAARVVINTPGALSQSSLDIPIHFSEGESAEQPPASNEWEQSTAPMMEVPSPYDDDAQQGETVRLDPQLTKPPSQKPRPKEDRDDVTDRMDQSEIQAITAAVREAREREKRRRG